MRSYVREFVRSLRFHQEHRYRKNVRKGAIGLRLTHDDLKLLQEVSAKWNMTVTGMAGLLLAEAVKDAANEVGMWRPEEEEEPVCQDSEE
jgi:hypothetical protein